MKKRMHSHKYVNIKDMEQLRLERARLHIQLDMKEEDLQYDYEQVKSMFSLRYLFGALSNGIGGLGGSPILSSISTGYGLISDMIAKRSKKRKAKQRRAISEADE